MSACWPSSRWQRPSSSGCPTDSPRARTASAQSHSLAFAGWFYRAVGDAPKGKVLVLSSGGYPDVSHGGGTKLPRVHNHGLAGVLTDGRLRDFGEMAEYDFAAWCGRGHTLGRWHCRPVGGEYARWRRMCPSRSGGSASLLAITSSPTAQARSSSRSAVCPMSWPRPAVSMQMSRVPFPRSALRPQADAGGRPAGHRSVKPGRQGVQQPSHPQLPAETRHPAHHSRTLGPAGAPPSAREQRRQTSRFRQGALQAAQRRRALLQRVKAVPSHRDTLRQNPRILRSRHHHRVTPDVDMTL